MEMTEDQEVDVLGTIELQDMSSNGDKNIEDGVPLMDGEEIVEDDGEVKGGRIVNYLCFYMSVYRVSICYVCEMDFLVDVLVSV